MTTQTTAWASAASSPARSAQAAAFPRELIQDPSLVRHERMPFTVRIVRDKASLDKAVQIRQAAYGRHVPDLASRLGAPELSDRADGAVVLLAESKFDGAPLGTMRIQTNRYRPLGVEQSVKLPDALKGEVLAEATRLGVCGGISGSVVKTMLFKAFYLYCLQERVKKMVIVARSPLDRQYEALMFNDVFADKAFLPMQHVGDIPHRVMVFDVDSARDRWLAAQHPLYGFVFLTEHADLDLSPVPLPAGRHAAVARHEAVSSPEMELRARAS
jgi:hypothetical protein